MSSVQRGRPRSESSRIAILTATRDLVMQNGYDGVTIAAIAERAGTGVQTLYRWWPDKAAIVAECVLENPVLVGLVTAPSTGDAVSDLRRWLGESYDALRVQPAGELFRALSVAAAKDPAIAARLDEQFGMPLRSALERLLVQGIESGQIRANVDLAATADVLLGAMLIAIVRRQDQPADRADAVVDIILNGLRPH